MKFLIDAMLPPQTAALLGATGHDATTPAELGAHNLPDETLIALASAERRVIVTENASDFAAVATCPVLLVRKAWWPPPTLASRLAASIERWAEVDERPGDWAHWLPEELR